MPRTFKDRMKAKMHKAGMTGLVPLSPTHASNRLSLLASSSELGARIKAVIVASFKVQEYLDNLRQNGKRVNVEQIRVLEGVPQFLALQKAVRNLTTYTMPEEIRAKVKLATREFYNKGTYDSFDDYMATVQEMAGAPAATEASMNIEARIKAHMAKAAYEPGAKHREIIANYCTVLIEYGHRWKADAMLADKGTAGSVGHIASNFYSAGIGVVMKGLAGIGKGLPADQEALIDKIFSGYHSGSFNWINDAKALLALVGGPKTATKAAVEVIAGIKNTGSKEWPEYAGGASAGWSWHVTPMPRRRAYTLELRNNTIGSAETVIKATFACSAKDAPTKSKDFVKRGIAASKLIRKFDMDVRRKSEAAVRKQAKTIEKGGASNTAYLKQVRTLISTWEGDLARKGVSVNNRIVRIGFKDGLKTYIKDSADILRRSITA